MKNKIKGLAAYVIIILAVLAFSLIITRNIAYSIGLIIPLLPFLPASYIIGRSKGTMVAIILFAYFSMCALGIWMLLDLDINWKYFFQIPHLEWVVGLPIFLWFVETPLAIFFGVLAYKQRWQGIEEEAENRWIDDLIGSPANVLGKKEKDVSGPSKWVQMPLPKMEESPHFSRGFLMIVWGVQGVMLSVMAAVFLSNAWVQPVLFLVFASIGIIALLGSWLFIMQAITMKKPRMLPETLLKPLSKEWYVIYSTYFKGKNEDPKMYEEIKLLVSLGEDLYRKTEGKLKVCIMVNTPKEQDLIELGPLPEGAIIVLNGGNWSPMRDCTHPHCKDKKYVAVKGASQFAPFALPCKTWEGSGIQWRILNPHGYQTNDWEKYPNIPSVIKGFNYCESAKLEMLTTSQHQGPASDSRTMAMGYEALIKLNNLFGWICSGSGTIQTSHYRRLHYLFQLTIGKWYNEVVASKFGEVIEAAEKSMELLLWVLKNVTKLPCPYFNRWGEDDLDNMMAKKFGLRTDVTNEQLETGKTENILRSLLTWFKWAMDLLNQFNNWFVARLYYPCAALQVLLMPLVAVFVVQGNFMSANTTLALVGATLLYPMAYLLNLFYLSKLKAKNSVAHDFIGTACAGLITTGGLFRAFFERCWSQHPTNARSAGFFLKKEIKIFGKSIKVPKRLIPFVSLFYCGGYLVVPPLAIIIAALAKRITAGEFFQFGVMIGIPYPESFLGVGVVLWIAFFATFILVILSLIVASCKCSYSEEFVAGG